MKAAPLKFERESGLCEAFLKTIPENWTAYAETGGFDILLAHANGVQIGIEAKLRLNAKVICQAIDGVDSRWNAGVGPDYRAILVPAATGDMLRIARHLCLTVITVCRSEGGVEKGDVNYEPGKPFSSGRLFSDPALPIFETGIDLERLWLHRQNWFDFSPETRITLPEFVPDVEAGRPAPRQLSKWKIQALRIVLLMEQRGALSPADFRAAKISMSMWTQSHWISPSNTRGVWVRGQNWPGDRWKSEHDTVVADIAADFLRWAEEVKISLKPLPMQEGLI